MNATSRRILLTGASRGLGLEFTRRWLEEGHHVFALARAAEASPGLGELARQHRDRLHRLRCDVTDDDAVARSRDAVQSRWDRLDILLNCAGTYGRKGQTDVENLDIDEVRQVFDVNVLGPLRVTRAFLALLRKGHQPRLVHVTSLMGSIGDNSSGGSYAYRMSKTALNMASRNLAHELKTAGIPSVVIHPGWVRTDMGGPDAPLTIEESVGAMVKTIDALTPEHGGTFLDRNGERLPW